MADKYLEVGTHITETESGGSGTAEAIGSESGLLTTKVEKPQTQKGESGVAEASGNQARELTQKSTRNETVYNNETPNTVVGQEARELSREDKIRTTRGESASSDPIDIEEKVLKEVLKFAGINLGQKTESLGKEHGTLDPKRNIVNTITVKEVKALIKKALKKYTPGGGGEGGGKVVDIGGGITEEILQELNKNPGSLVDYGGFIYVPTYIERDEYNILDIYYNCVASDENQIYYLIISFEDEAISDEGTIDLAKLWIFVTDNPSGYEDEDHIDRIIRKQENDGSIIETYVIDKIVKASTLVISTADTSDYENGEEFDGDPYGIFENIHDIFGVDYALDDYGNDYIVNYNQDGETTYGIRFGDSLDFGYVILVDCTPNKVIRVIVGKYFEYNELGEKVFDEHCALYSDEFAENPQNNCREITEERQVFELKTNSEGHLYFDSDGSDLGFDSNRFILYGFEVGEAESTEYKARQIDSKSYPEVQIERVWLSYDTGKSIRSDYLGLKDDNGQPFINDSTKIWYNFKTTPIFPLDEQAIKDGKFVIRLDYPIKNKSYFEKDGITKTTTRKNGPGTRSFAPNFLGSPDQMIAEKKQILLDSLIFITENDIKVNDVGQKYIHKKVSLFDFINNICVFIEDRSVKNLSPITLEELQTQDGQLFYCAWLDAAFSCGIPARWQNGYELFELRHFTGSQRNKFANARQTGYSSSDAINHINSVKLNPAFSCYTILNLEYGSGVSLYSPYFFNKKGSAYISYNYDFVITVRDVECHKRKTRKAYMSARPRCAILNDNFEYADKAFVRKYPQSEQQIRLYCKCIKDLDTGNYGFLPVFRTLITQK